MKNSRSDWHDAFSATGLLLKATLVVFVFFCVVVNSSTAMSADALPSGSEVQYSQGDHGESVWTIVGPDGVVLKFSPEVKQKYLREVFFPRSLKFAKTGIPSKVWPLGLFYLDGVATEKDLEKAETAFRRGLEIQRPEGFVALANVYVTMATKQDSEANFKRAADLYLEILDAGLKIDDPQSIAYLASVYSRGLHGVKKDFDRAELLLRKIDETQPGNGYVQLKIAEIRYHQKRYIEAIEYAEDAQEGLSEDPEKLRFARSLKISAALFGGHTSKLTREDLVESCVKGPAAWSILGVLVLALGSMLWWTRRALRKEPSDRPGLRLSLSWMAVSVVGAGIGFNIQPPGMEGMFITRWIGAILVGMFCLMAITGQHWRHYFGRPPFFTGTKAFFKGLAITVVCVGGMMVVMLGYSEIYQWSTGGSLEQQLVRVLMKSENGWQVCITLLAVGITIPFFEEVIFRGFLYETLDHRVGAKTALVVSSVVFAFAHGITYGLPLLFLSFALGWVRMKTGNIKLTFFIHAANNSFATLLGYFLAT